MIPKDTPVGTKVWHLNWSYDEPFKWITEDIVPSYLEDSDTPGVRSYFREHAYLTRKEAAAVCLKQVAAVVAEGQKKMAELIEIIVAPVEAA